VAEVTGSHPEKTAWYFLGNRQNYRDFLASIDKTAAVSSDMGVKPGDVMTVCLPNCPQAL